MERTALGTLLGNNPDPCSRKRRKSSFFATLGPDSFKSPALAHFKNGQGFCISMQGEAGVINLQLAG